MECGHFSLTSQPQKHLNIYLLVSDSDKGKNWAMHRVCNSSIRSWLLHFSQSLRQPLSQWWSFWLFRHFELRWFAVRSMKIHSQTKTKQHNRQAVDHTRFSHFKPYVWNKARYPKPVSCSLWFGILMAFKLLLPILAFGGSVACSTVPR